MEQLWRHTVRRVNGTCTVALAGEVDMSVSPDLARVLTDEAGRAGTSEIVVDLDALVFLDSSGVNALVTGYRAARVAGGRFVVTNVRGHIRRVLTVTGVWDALTA